MWALGGPTALAKTNRNGKHSSNTGYSDDEDDDDIPAEEETEKLNDDTDQMHRRLWCICKKPWDHSRLMLRCDSCANWYHGDW
jgi:nucleosome-remodeling factor subunit BPTF